MKYLFTKVGCRACEKIKKTVDLDGMDNVRIFTLDNDNSEALAMLAYYECVSLSEKQLPILVSDTREVIVGPDNICRNLVGN